MDKLVNSPDKSQEAAQLVNVAVQYSMQVQQHLLGYTELREAMLEGRFASGVGLQNKTMMQSMVLIAKQQLEEAFKLIDALPTGVR